MSSARSSVIAKNRAAHIEVIVGGQISRFRIFHSIHHPKIGLGVRANRLRDRAMKRKLATIGTQREVTNIHRNRSQLLRVASCGCNRINICGWKFVVRLVYAPGEEINMGTVVAPDEVPFIVIAAGDLHGLTGFLAGFAQNKHPNMAVALQIEVALIVIAINGSADDMDIGFMFVFSVAVSFLLTLGFLNVLRCSVADKRDSLAVGRPDCTGSAFRQVGNGASFSSGKRKERQLTGLGLPGLILLAGADKDQILTVGRPAGLRIVLSVGHAHGSLLSIDGGEPDRCFISSTLLVAIHARECHLGSIRRELWVGHPDELKQIFVGKQALVRGSWRLC